MQVTRLTDPFHLVQLQLAIPLIVTDDSGIVTDDSGIVTGRSGDRARRNETVKHSAL